jgi:hypothetical protein
MGVANMAQYQPGPSGFSWLDLGGAMSFATQNNSGGSTGESDDMLLENGLSPYDMDNMLSDYSYTLLDGDNPNLIF